MKLDERKTRVCVELEADLSAFVDGEHDSVDVDKLMKHLDECSHCRSFLDQLRQMAHLHRSCFTEEEILESFDGAGLFQDITSELIEERISKVAELFYQIGKAYLVKGFNLKRHAANKRGIHKRNNLRIKMRPIPVEAAKMKTGRLFREMSDLAASANNSNRRLMRARTFFSKNRPKNGRHTDATDYLELGRRFIEECLAINPEKVEPRMYLGSYFISGVRKYQEAKKQFLKVLDLKALTEEQRIETLWNLGVVYSLECKYIDAKAYYERALETEAVKKNPRFCKCYMYLAVVYAKLGEYDQSVSSFEEMAQRFPGQMDSVRQEITGMQNFMTVVSKQQGYQRELKDRIPVLFAS